MIGSLQDTIGNTIVFVYVGWLIWLWGKPAKGDLMPLPAYMTGGDNQDDEDKETDADDETKSGFTD
jgi:hypothetical protein